MLTFEKQHIQNGCVLIAGMDEAGRGPLAGPVTVCAVIMPLDEANIIDGVNDSKQLSAKKREELFDKIVAKALDYSISFVDEKTIDQINILNATKQGMQECVAKLKLKPDMVLIDAVKLPLPVPSQSIIHGDALSYSIACASILAKVSRDRFMTSISSRYANYNFAKHKGYGTKEHIEKLREFGVCDIHRKTFVEKFIS